MKGEEDEEDRDGWGSRERGRENGLSPRLPLNLPGFPLSHSHTTGARSRLPSITAQGKALSLISGSQRGLHNCSKKPNQKANLRASKLHVTLSAGSESCNRITSHAYLFFRIQGGIFRWFKARHDKNRTNPSQNK